MEIRFENKVAFITGAAGGIGYAAARMFAEAGASVVMVDLDGQITARAKELEAEGHDAIGIRCDVSDEAQVKAAVEKAVAVFGKLDIAYNNVGIHAAVREDLAETEGWDFDHVISVNLRVELYEVRTCRDEKVRQGSHRELLVAGRSGRHSLHRGLQRL